VGSSSDEPGWLREVVGLYTSVAEEDRRGRAYWNSVGEFCKLLGRFGVGRVSGDKCEAISGACESLCRVGSGAHRGCVAETSGGCAGGDVSRWDRFGFCTAPAAGAGSVLGVCESALESGGHAGARSVDTGEVDAGVAAGPRSSGLSSVSAVGVEVVRGKHYLSNKRKKLARKARVVSDGKVPLLEGASEEQRKEFITSRLQMMTAKNNLMAAKAADQKKYVDDRAFTRVAERKLELERLEIDAKLKKLEEADGNDFGFDGCTVASEPSLSTGTVSPNSSISVAEEMRLRRAVAKLQTQLKDTQLVLELERTVGGKEKDELKEKYALAVNANLEKVAGGLVIKTSSTGKEFLGMANELDDDGESYPDIEFSQPSFNGEEVW